MVRVEIDWETCQGCHLCSAVRSCNVRAIVKIGPEEPAYIESARCHGCGKCIPACSFAAIRLVDTHLHSFNETPGLGLTDGHTF